MRPVEQDWLELGFRVAKAMHDQIRWARSYLEQATVEAKGAAEQEEISIEPQGGMHMAIDNTVTLIGNLTDDPQVRHTEGGLARARSRVAVSRQREQEPSFFT